MKNDKIRWLTRTAVLLALLIVLQAATMSLGQIVTGSCVNAVLAVAVLCGGLWCGVTVAVVSPVVAFLLNITPQVVTVPAIMVGNAVFVLVLHVADGKAIWRKVLAWIGGAAVKFGVLYALVVWIICGVASAGLLEAGVLKPPMLAALTTKFGLPQLITALIGGGVAVLIAPVINKAQKKI